MVQDLTKITNTEIASQLRKILLRAKKIANEVFSGNYHSAFRGHGLEFDHVREYMIGDDVRRIDWNVSARQRKTFIKTFRDERELSIVIAVDCSRSLYFGSQTKQKRDLAVEIAATLAYTAFTQQDRVGLMLFTDKVELFLPPNKGKSHVFKLIKEVAFFEASSPRTKIATALDFLRQRLPKKSTIFLISDFIDQGFFSTLKAVAMHHDLVAIDIADHAERQLPPIGYVAMRSLESNESIIANTSQPSHPKEKVDEQQFLAAGADYLNLTTQEDYFQSLLQFFYKRENRGSR